MDDHEKILQIFDRMLNNFHSGVLAYVVLSTIRDEYQRSQEMEDDIFIGTLVVSAYNTMVLALANTVKSSKGSMHLDYMFNITRNSKDHLNIESYDQLISFIDEFEDELKKISRITDHAIHLRDTSVAHLDRKHVNNPSSLLQKPPARWEDINLAYTVVGSGLLEIGKLLGLITDDIEGYVSISNYVLAKKTRSVYRLLYGLD